MATLAGNIADMIHNFGTAAGVDPLSAVLVTIGILLTTFAAVSFGLLAVGGILSPLTKA